MTNRIAIVLAILIVALLVADGLWLHLDLPVRGGKALNGAIEYLSFWH